MALSLTEQFKAWLRTKPADEQYPYRAIYGCAVFQFLQDNGFPVRIAGGGGLWCDLDGQWHQIPGVSWGALANTPHTFGALLARLEAQPNSPAA